MRSCLRAKPHLRRCLCRCRHCRIFFLTHPRNAGRRELLRCFFGCRREHRRRESIRRSTEYYRGELGREYKRRQNQRQRGQVEILGLQSAKAPAPLPTPKASCPEEILQALPAAKDPEILEHVRVVVSLIEDRWISLQEIWEMLLRV